MIVDTTIVFKSLKRGYISRQLGGKLEELNIKGGTKNGNTV